MFELDSSTCRELIETSTNGVIVIDADLRIVYINEIFAKFSGYTKEELINASVFKLIPEDDFKKTKDIVERVFKGEWIFEEVRYKTKYGDVRWALGLIRPMERKGKIYGIGNYADITELKELSRKLEESERFYRELVEFSAAPICIIQNGKFVFINNAALEFLGYTREEIIEMNPFDLIHPDDREVVLRKYWEVEQGLKDAEIHSFRVIAKYRVGTFTMVARRITYNEKSAVYVTGFEITKIFSLYEELKKRNEVMISLLSKLKENIDAMANLVDRIRNPLSALLGYVELFESENIKIKIFEQIRRIDDIVSKIDQEWIKSEETVGKLEELKRATFSNI
ncbi:MAG: PAS domain S-box protein [Archaeoglobaceae archaeon]|nr:PAS domain S-box protein [Archaeoglobaceae archaeon]